MIVVVIEGIELCCCDGMKFSLNGDRASNWDCAGDSMKPSSPIPLGEESCSGGGVGVRGGRGLGTLDAIVGGGVVACYRGLGMLLHGLKHYLGRRQSQFTVVAGSRMLKNANSEAGQSSSNSVVQLATDWIN